MKEHSGSISSIHFNQFPGTFSKRVPKHRAKEIQRKLIDSHWESITTCLTTVGIGTIIFATTYFFFIQLAEYGW